MTPSVRVELGQLKKPNVIYGLKDRHVLGKVVKIEKEKICRVQLTSSLLYATTWNSNVTIRFTRHKN